MLKIILSARILKAPEVFFFLTSIIVYENTEGVPLLFQHLDAAPSLDVKESTPIGKPRTEP
jgi:hypothetical protein